MNLIGAALDRKRTVVMMLVLLLISGATTYINIAKEDSPDITIPMVYVSISHEGISPEDADRLLIAPIYNELQGLEGIKKIKSTASQGHGSITLEFYTGTDIDQAILDVRERVDKGKVELPEESEEPVIQEINIALFPVLVVTLAGPIEERVLVNIANKLKDQLEAIPDVLEAKVQGTRDEMVEVIIDPLAMESYGLSQRDVHSLVSNNNRLIAAGILDTGKGRTAIKVPGLIESDQDILNLPVKVSDDQVVLFKDIATARRTFKDPSQITRVNGQPAVTIEIKKRIGSNIVNAINSVKAKIEDAKPNLPEELEIGFTQDQSKRIANTLNDLTNNVLFATLLVMLVIVAALGFTSSALVGIAIPGSFLCAILALNMMGMTLNMVVLFSLILAVGMLVDGAIVVTEYADRKMAEGVHREQAYREAAQRMAWPVIASTATTLAVFMPLMFWPDTTGEFMKYMPITMIATLTASLVMALIAVPTLGAIFGRPGKLDPAMAAAERGDFDQIKGGTARYLSLLRTAITHPIKVLMIAVGILFLVPILYGKFGHGVEFFPETDAETASITVRSHGDFSLNERDKLVREIESELLVMPEIKTVYSNTIANLANNYPEDTVGVIQFELLDWRERRSTKAILEDLREKTKHYSGLILEMKQQEKGPAQGSDIQLILASLNQQDVAEAAVELTKMFHETGQLTDISNSLPLSGVEWVVEVDRAEASRFGADVNLIGSTVQMITNGIKMGNFRPDDAEDEVEIRLRFPFNNRNLDQLNKLRIQTNEGLMPISYFVKTYPKPKVTTISRAFGWYMYTVEANVKPGVVANTVLQPLLKDFNNTKKAGVEVGLLGDQEQQMRSQEFLKNAFIVALFVMAIILVTQFNSFYQAALILSAVIFSTAGVLIGLMIKQEPFGIVMSGVGVIALAGIVVNNNIVLIDTYNIIRQSGVEPFEAALRTGTQRLRPVMLTTVTTILGLIPMVFQLNIDFLNLEVSVGAPSSQWWTQLATAIAGGLAFATLLTLFLTPSLLVLGEKLVRSKQPKEALTTSLDQA